MRGVVLAGGNASRFSGKPKGLEQVGGTRILDRVIRAVKEATGDAPLLVANAEDASEWRPDLKVMRDAIRGCGSLGGIYTAVSAGEGHALVVAWDMPFVSADLLKALVNRSGSFDAVLPERRIDDEVSLEPLCAVYGPNCLAPIRSQLVKEDFRVQGFLGAVKAGKIPCDSVQAFGDPATLFFNVNTPDDLKRAEELWRDQYQR
ncbi:MAG: molybdenum cofactor guanylyltransferase [Gemmatimonadota bacterium]|nr:MAG: molybdenum cofactor guanylyltransferase [Gemmatimonadota bacterium]